MFLNMRLAASPDCKAFIMLHAKQSNISCETLAYDMPHFNIVNRSTISLVCNTCVQYLRASVLFLKYQLDCKLKMCICTWHSLQLPCSWLHLI